MGLILVIALAIALSACAKFSVPVSGKLSDGTVAAGVATASITGEGTFTVEAGGVKCSGIYDAMDMSRSFTVPVTCPDGRKGTADVRRSPDGMSGTAVVKLEDGTVGQFVFGKYKYDEAFGGPAAPTAN